MRERERRTPTAHDLPKVPALNSEPGAEKTVGVSIEFGASGGLKGTAVSADDVGTFTAHAFMYKHCVLMNAVAFAAAPGSWTTTSGSS